MNFHAKRRVLMKNYLPFSKITILMIIVSLVSLCICGCTPPRQPTLAEMYRWELRDFDSKQLNNFLDQSFTTKENRRQYWEPVMESLVLAKSKGELQALWIPMEHMERAINNYNQTRNFSLQESAVYLYYYQLFLQEQLLILPY